MKNLLIILSILFWISCCPDKPCPNCSDPIHDTIIEYDTVFIPYPVYDTITEHDTILKPEPYPVHDTIFITKDSIIYLNEYKSVFRIDDIGNVFYNTGLDTLWLPILNLTEFDYLYNDSDFIHFQIQIEEDTTTVPEDTVITELPEYILPQISGSMTLEKGIYRGSVTVNNKDNVTLKGNGTIISGSKIYTGFTRNGNIWSKVLDFTSDSTKKIAGIYINDQFCPINRSDLRFATSSNATQINDVSLTGNWSDAEIVVRINNFQYERRNIASQSGTILTLRESLSIAPTLSACGYYLQNSDKLLLKSGDWCYNYAKKELKVYYTGDLNSQRVEVPVEDIGLNLISCDNFRIEGITFQHFNKYCIEESYGTLDINNCIFKNAASAFYIHERFVKDKIHNSSFDNLLSAGMYITSHSVDIQGNHFDNIGMIAGMTSGTYARNYTAISTWVSRGSSLISGNSFKNVGYIPVKFIRNANMEVSYNIIDGFCRVLDDGGGIYTYGNDSASYIHHNTIKRGFKAPVGARYNIPATAIYWDENTKNCRTEYNTIDSCAYALYTNSPVNNIFRYNTATNVYRYLVNLAGSYSGNTIDYNTYNDKKFIVQYIEKTFSEWKNYGFDLNSVIK